MRMPTAGMKTLISAEQWFSEGRRVAYDPARHVMLGEAIAGSVAPVFVFERVVGGSGAAMGERWLTLLPGFPDGSYGYAAVNEKLGADATPRLFIEYVGQGDSDTPRDYPYSTFERADLVEAQWQAHGVRRTFVVTFDYSSLALLELLARQEERLGRGEALATRIEAVFIVNGGLFADAHSHPWQTTPLLKTSMGAVAARFAQRSPALFTQLFRAANMFSRQYAASSAEFQEEYAAITRRDGAAFLHLGAGFVDEHRAHGARWDLARLYHALSPSVRFCVAGSEEDPYEPKQIQAARERLGADGLAIRTFPGGHLTTSEHPDLLAEAINELAHEWRAHA